MAFLQERQGCNEDLSTKSVTELKALLYRQEKLFLNKPKLLAKFPDQGEKIRKFKEKIEHLIAEKEEKENKNLFKDEQRFNITAEENVETKTSVSKVKSSKKESKFAQERKERKMKELQQSNVTPSDILESLAEGINQDCEAVEIVLDIRAENQSIEKPKEKVVTNNDFSALRDRSAVVNDLEDSLQRLDIADEHLSDDDNTGFTKHEEKNIKRFSQKSTDSSTKFKPNSTLRNKTSKKQSDEDEVGSVDVEKVSPMDTHRRTRDLALEGPVYKYNQSKLISLEESITLQRHQKKMTEDMQAKHAAERLAERLNITMETYNPEGTDMSYRQNEPDLDSDDEPEDANF